MKNLCALLAFALLSLNAQSGETNSHPSANDDDAAAIVGAPKIQFFNRHGTKFFSASPLQQLPDSFANTPAATFDHLLLELGCTALNEGRFHCGSEVLQSGGDSVWWRFQKNGRLGTTYVYVND